jgi:hypothetical protein
MQQKLRDALRERDELRRRVVALVAHHEERDDWAETRSSEHVTHQEALHRAECASAEADRYHEEAAQMHERLRDIEDIAR